MTSIKVLHVSTPGFLHQGVFQNKIIQAKHATDWYSIDLTGTIKILQFNLTSIKLQYSDIKTKWQWAASRRTPSQPFTYSMCSHMIHSVDNVPLSPCVFKCSITENNIGVLNIFVIGFLNTHFWANTILSLMNLIKKTHSALNSIPIFFLLSMLFNDVVNW
jgi:hypothetical protein